MVGDVERVDYRGGAESFHRARTLPPEVLLPWRDAIDRVGLAPSRPVLDVGSGTGGFLDALQAWFATPVIGVEPSPAMRSVAAGASLVERFPMVAAWGEALPLHRHSIDVAWLSTVVHQFADPGVVATELRRVVHPAGCVLVRGYFSDVDVTGLATAFPGIERAAAAFPSTPSIAGCFEGAGWRLDSAFDVVEPWRLELATWIERVRSLRSVDSMLRRLTDAEVDEGLRVVTETHRGAFAPIANDATLRLVVLRRAAG